MCSESGTPKTCDTGLKASINIDLYEVGDSAEYDITISNKGNIDAKLDDVVIDNTDSNSAVLITYSGYSKGERLFKSGTPGNSKTIHVKVAYNPEYSKGEISSEIDLTFEFVQAEAGTIPDTYVLTYDYQTNGGTYPTSSGTTTLTSWYSSNIASNLQSKIVNHLWNVGPVASNSSRTLAQDIEEESYKWRGKIGLMNITDYVRASTNSECNNVYNYNSTSSCYNNSSTHNRLYNGSSQWTISPHSSSGTSYVWSAKSPNLSNNTINNSYGARPVLYLSSSKSISGSGTSGSPFVAS